MAPTAIAMSVSPPIVMPMSARASAGASFTPPQLLTDEESV
jgi:hypothetical protein